MTGLLDHLPSGMAKTALEKQIGLISYVQRHKAWNEVNFYYTHLGRLSHPDKLRINLPTVEVNPLNITFRMADGAKSETKVWFVNGLLFSLKFPPEIYPTRLTGKLEVTGIESNGWPDDSV